MSSIRGLTAPSVRCSTFTICLRSLTTTAAVASTARTYPSKPVPGSKEDKEPYAWANRLFKLKELRKGKDIEEKSEPSKIHMVCRLMPLKGLPYYERAMLELYGIGENVKVSFLNT